MARLNFVKKARKDIPGTDIKAGDPYYWWQFYKSRKQYSKERPRQSQLIGSDKLARVCAAGEDYDALVSDFNAGTMPVDDVPDNIREIAERVREVAEEYNDAASNIRDSFSESATADECEEKAGRCEEIADELDGIADEVEGEEADVEEGKEPTEDQLTAQREAVSAHLENCPDFSV